MVNSAGVGVLVKYHWKSQQGIESLSEEQAAAVQANELGHASKDLYEAIERGEYPQWELNVQIMSDDEHPELDFDPLDDTKAWPEEVFPLRPAGMMTLNRNVTSFHNENEQIAFGTGVLVDGLDFSDDKMLVGRTFSYSDTQRYRVGPNYLQLPVNRPREDVLVSTNTTVARCRTGWTTGARTRTSTSSRPRWRGCARPTSPTANTVRSSRAT
jgi:catalase